MDDIKVIGEEVWCLGEMVAVINKKARFGIREDFKTFLEKDHSAKIEELQDEVADLRSQGYR